VLVRKTLLPAFILIPFLACIGCGGCQGCQNILGADNASLSAPTNLVLIGTTQFTVTFSWTASTDAKGVVGYKIYRNSSEVGKTTGTSYGDVGLLASTTYNYSVAAYDSAGKTSAMSNPLVATTDAASGARTTVFPLKASANKRYLVDQKGTPVLLVGDSPHTLFTNVSESDAVRYFADRASHGVNALWAEILVNSALAGRSNGSTVDGIAPFTTVNDFSTPNPAYFQRVDDMVHLAGQYGITIFMDALENDGWMNIVEQNGAAKDFNFGAYLGNRYKDFPNIIWIVGNDFQTWNSNATDNADALAIIQGIQSTDKNHLLATELNFNMSGSLDDLLLAPNTTLAGAYTYFPPYYEVTSQYNNPQTTPVFLEESYYDSGELYGNLNPTTASPLMLRKVAYESILSGSLAGYLYGSSYWKFQSGWQTGIDSQGAADLSRWGSFFNSIPFYNLAPDQSHGFVTGGFGNPSGNNTGNIQTDDYVTSATSSDGTLGVVYLPSAAKSISVNMAQFSGKVGAQWFDPTSGIRTPVSGSPFSNSGSQLFAAPGTNSSGDSDWVLLFQVQ
jgi:hypothetical protein